MRNTVIGSYGYPFFSVYSLSSHGIGNLRKPRILITTDVGEVGMKRRLSATTAMGYIQSAENAGGIPLLLPPLSTEECLSDLLNEVDAVICIGGPDYRRGGEHSYCRYVDTLREEHDFRLISMVLKTRIPLLGICLGLQLMNVSTGGTLYRHLEESVPHALNHATVNHEVMLSRDSKMLSSLGKQFLVNSSHHQAIRTVGQGFSGSAHAPDGIVEMIERRGDVFRLGVQWHPERMPDSPVQKKLFSSFIWSAMNEGQWP